MSSRNAPLSRCAAASRLRAQQSGVIGWGAVGLRRGRHSSKTSMWREFPGICDFRGGDVKTWLMEIVRKTCSYADVGSRQSATTCGFDRRRRLATAVAIFPPPALDVHNFPSSLPHYPQLTPPPVILYIPNPFCTPPPILSSHPRLTPTRSPLPTTTFLSIHHSSFPGSLPLPPS